MANFKTHISVAAVASGVFATVFLGTGVATPEEVVILAMVGTIGGILPDIDLDHSSPTKIMFTALGLIFAFMVMFSKASQYSILELWIVWGLSYASIRYLAWKIFAELTVHRGIYHSLLAAFFFFFFVTALCYHFFDFSQLTAWLIGFFVFFGFIVHLLLDEWYSVDFNDEEWRIKRSFGTAFKVFDYDNYLSSSLMATAMILAYLMTPNANPFLDLFTSGDTYQTLWNNLFPSGMWFKL